MDKNEERLDEALNGFMKGEEETEGEFQPLMSALQALAPLKDVPTRDPKVAAAGRLSFLKQARSIPQPVSAAPRHRLMDKILRIRKERRVMGTLLGVLLAIAVAFGGAGATVAAAQDSLPPDMLYPAKTWFEDLRLALMGDPDNKLDLLLDLAGERVRELSRMAEAGIPVPEEVPVRLQEQLELALQEANRLQGEAKAQALERIRTASMIQAQVLQGLNLGEGSGVQEGVQECIQALVRTQTQAEGSLEDPSLIRYREGLNRPETAPTQPDGTPQQGQETEPAGQGPGGDLGQQGPGGPSQEATPQGPGDGGEGGSGPNDDSGGQGPRGPGG